MQSWILPERAGLLWYDRSLPPVSLFYLIEFAIRLKTDSGLHGECPGDPDRRRE